MLWENCESPNDRIVLVKKDAPSNIIWEREVGTLEGMFSISLSQDEFQLEGEYLLFLRGQNDEMKAGPLVISVMVLNEISPTVSPVSSVSLSVSHENGL